MKHGYFAVFGCACLLGLALISCDPVGAVEIGVDDQTGIYDYLDSGAQNLQQIDFSLDSDEDGNRSVRLKIYGLQKLALYEQSGIYDNMDFSAAPDSVTVSGSGRSGIYIDDSGYYQPCTLYTVSGSLLQSKTLCSSPDFTVVLQSDSDINYTFKSDPGFQGVAYWLAYNYTGRTYRNTTGTRSGSYSEPNYGGSYVSGLGVQINTTNQLPHLSSMDFTASSVTVCGSAQNISLPTGTIDTQNPWDYYNNVLLPYMEEEFPGFDDYFVFPDGYTPPEPPPQVPTEFPTLPGYDFDIQPVGTLPAGAENAAYDMPDVPVKVVPVPSFDLTKINPAEIIAPFANGLQGIWALITDTLVSYDLLPVVSLCFLVLIITAFLALGVK